MRGGSGPAASGWRCRPRRRVSGRWPEPVQGPAVQVLDVVLASGESARSVSCERSRERGRLATGVCSGGPAAAGAVLGAARRHQQLEDLQAVCSELSDPLDGSAALRTRSWLPNPARAAYCRQSSVIWSQCPPVWSACDTRAGRVRRIGANAVTVQVIAQYDRFEGGGDGQREVGMMGLPWHRPRQTFERDERTGLRSWHSHRALTRPNYCRQTIIRTGGRSQARLRA